MTPARALLGGFVTALAWCGAAALLVFVCAFAAQAEPLHRVPNPLPPLGTLGAPNLPTTAHSPIGAGDALPVLETCK